MVFCFGYAVMLLPIFGTIERSKTVNNITKLLWRDYSYSRVQSRHPGPSGAVRMRSRLPGPGWQLLSRHRRSAKKTALGRDSNAFRQLDADQLWQLQCRWISSLELSADGPQTAGLVIQPSQTVAEDILFGQWEQSAVWIPLELRFRILLFIYLLTCVWAPPMVSLCTGYTHGEWTVWWA